MDPASFHRDSGDLEHRLAAALARLSLVGRHELGRMAASGGLSPMQSLILERLARIGPSTVGLLARELGVTAPTASDSIAALERGGLVTRHSVPGDGRRVEVRATARGARLGREQAIWPDLFASAVASLPEEEKAALLRILLRVVAELVARGVVREARLCPTCEFFRPRAHPGSESPHHCALVDLPLSDAHLRADCPDHRTVAAEEIRRRLPALA